MKIWWLGSERFSRLLLRLASAFCEIWRQFRKISFFARWYFLRYINFTLNNSFDEKGSQLLFHGYNALFMKKGRVFLKESTLSENSYYEKEEGRHKDTKEIGNLNSAMKNPTAQKTESTRKKSVYLPPNPQKLCLWILLKRVDSFPHFFVLNTGFLSGSGSRSTALMRGCLKYKLRNRIW